MINIKFLSSFLSNSFSKIKEWLEKPSTNLILAAFLAVLFLYFDFALMKLLTEQEFVRNALRVKPYGVLKNFVIFCFLVTVVFSVIHRHFPNSPKILRFSWFFFVFHASFFALFWAANHFISHRLDLFQHHALLFSILWNVIGMSMAAAALLTFTDFVQFGRIILLFKKEWALSLIFSSLFLGVSPFLKASWQPLSYYVGKTAKFFLSLTYSGTFFNTETFFIGVREFAVYILQPCSGAEGIRLFVFLFTALIIADWKRIRKGPMVLLYLTGITIMFFANVVRIYLILLLGYEVYKKFGHQLAYKIVLDYFHTNFGWIFYMVIFLIFMRLTYPFLTRTSQKEKQSV